MNFPAAAAETFKGGDPRKVKPATHAETFKGGHPRKATPKAGESPIQIFTQPGVKPIQSLPSLDLSIITDESCLACVMSKKYVVWVTLKPLGSIRRGGAELHTL